MGAGEVVGLVVMTIVGVAVVLGVLGLILSSISQAYKH